jgi:hypothetical protein
MSKIGFVLLVTAIWAFIAGREMVPIGGQDWDGPPADGDTGAQRVPPITHLLWIGVVLIVCAGLVVWANLGIADWGSAKHVRPEIFIPALIPLMAGPAFLGRLIEHRLRVGVGAPEPVPTIGLEAHEKAVWFGSAHNHVMFGALIALALFMWVGADVGPAGLVVATFSVLIALFFCWIRVVVRQRQIEIGFGPWHWPKKIVSLDDIDQATTEHVQPLRYGGWGYRLCGTGCRAIVVRRGDALKLKMHDQKLLIVTVDHAEEAAGLINDLQHISPR